MKATINYKYLNLIELINFDLWDTKRYTSKGIVSTYPIVSLENCIQEENKKYKLNEDETKYGILGVNNKEGIFDAYLQKGKDINQSYKKMENGWIAYNPYRINVGSIGIRLKEHKNEFISPAYVVFSCLENLKPEFLFLLFKTERFNKVINESTTGSVRQNLTISTLKSLQIPLPSLEEQDNIVNTYQDKTQQANKLVQQSQNLEEEIEKYFLEQLELKPFKLKEKSKGLLTIPYNELERWDYFSSDTRIRIELQKSKFKLPDVTHIFSFTRRSFNKTKYKKETFNYIEIGAIDPTKGILKAKEVLTKKAPSRATQIVKTGDLIIGTTRPYLKKFALVTNEYNDNVCSSGFSVIETSNDYSLPYLLNFLKCSYGIEQLKNRMTGGLYPAITSRELKEIKIPFPTAEKQKEIMVLVKEKENTILSNKARVKTLKREAKKEFENTIFS